jgi:hypothetical protein
MGMSLSAMEKRRKWRVYLSQDLVDGCGGWVGGLNLNKSYLLLIIVYITLYKSSYRKSPFERTAEQRTIPISEKILARRPV